MEAAGRALKATDPKFRHSFPGWVHKELFRSFMRGSRPVVEAPEQAEP